MVFAMRASMTTEGLVAATSISITSTEALSRGYRWKRARAADFSGVTTARAFGQKIYFSVDAYAAARIVSACLLMLAGADAMRGLSAITISSVDCFGLDVDAYGDVELARRALTAILTDAPEYDILLRASMTLHDDDYLSPP